MAIQKMENNGEAAEKLEPSCIVGENVNGTAIMAACQLNTTCLFLDIYPGELKARTKTDTCTLMFIVALFTIAEQW